MKIAIGMRPFEGAWGGGNRFVAALTEGIARAGHEAVHTLDDGDIDIILLVDLRTRSPNVTFGAGAILRYVVTRNPRALVVHRINECDERKSGRHRINRLLARANYVADATVFVGSWLAELPIWRQHLRDPWTVILNGADPDIFHARGFVPWTGGGPMKLVTHHWGYDRNKGFDVYEAIDSALGDALWSARFAMTYVGNLPRGFKFSNVRHVAPLNGTTLADELRSHHAYVTASINEPGGNHQNEGALCGLPLIYRESGCLPEYCQRFGVGFADPEGFFQAADHMAKEYETFVPLMGGYPHTSMEMVRNWVALFDHLHSERQGILARRRLFRSPTTALLTQVPLT
ncbi:MAG: hypothetical protein ACOYLQ_15995 [Hyphomicrobiaceae bacterium]